MVPTRPTKPLTREVLDEELSFFERRVLAEVDRRMSGQSAGLTAVIKALVEQTVTATMAPLRDVIEWARHEKLRREVTIEVTKELSESVGAQVKLADQLATLGDKRLSGGASRRTATITVCISLFLALGGLGTCSALSHYRPQSQPSTSSAPR